MLFRGGTVDQQTHARFSAVSRSYEYHLELWKNPFTRQTAFHFPQAKELDFLLMQEAARLLLGYEEFFPFCKSNSDAKTMKCELTRSVWIEEDRKYVFHISANRFLRGMVRLIVGMSLNVGMGKLELEEVKAAMDTQTRLPKNYSVPPEGLFLTRIVYPFQ